MVSPIYLYIRLYRESKWLKMILDAMLYVERVQQFQNHVCILYMMLLGVVIIIITYSNNK